MQALTPIELCNYYENDILLDHSNRFCDESFSATYLKDTDTNHAHRLHVIQLTNSCVTALFKRLLAFKEQNPDGEYTITYGAPAFFADHLRRVIDDLMAKVSTDYYSTASDRDSDRAGRRGRVYPQNAPDLYREDCNEQSRTLKFCFNLRPAQDKKSEWDGFALIAGTQVLSPDEYLASLPET